MHLMRSLFSFKRLRSTYLGREKIQQQQHQWPASFFFLSFFWGREGNGAGEHGKGRVVTGIKDSHGFWIPRPGFRSLLVKFGFWIPNFSMIPDSLSCIPDSKAQDSGFHKKKFPGVRNPDFLDMEREEEAPAVTP